VYSLLKQILYVYSLFNSSTLVRHLYTVLSVNTAGNRYQETCCCVYLYQFNCLWWIQLQTLGVFWDCRAAGKTLVTCWLGVSWLYRWMRLQMPRPTRAPWPDWRSAAAVKFTQ